MHRFQVVGLFGAGGGGSLSTECELKHWASAATLRIFLKNEPQEKWKLIAHTSGTVCVLACTCIRHTK